MNSSIIAGVAFRVLFGLVLTAICAQARINVVSLPGRDSVQLTIYNSADLTLVKETRLLTFKKGINRLEFSWANTLIDPTSVEFRALTNADKVDVLDVSFPARVTNTLEWRIASEVAGEVKCEIRYFTSGISWGADYVVEADRAEKLMQLAGSVRVNNRSGEDYENAQIRLVVGVIRLVERIGDLASKGDPKSRERLSELGRMTDGHELNDPAKEMAKSQFRRTFDRDGEGGGKRAAAEVVKESLGEYFLYTVEGRDTVANGWSKRLPSFVAKEVPIISYYKYERERWGDSVMRYYKFTNAVPSKLGKEPLPDGNVMAFRTVADDKLYSFVGRTSVKYIPIAETVELELGNDAEVLVKPTLMDWVKAELAFDGNGNVKGWATKETWRFEVQNSKEIDVVLDIRRNFAGDWGMVTEQKFEKVDATKVKFVLPLKPREAISFTYELTTRHGSNVTK